MLHSFLACLLLFAAFDAPAVGLKAGAAKVVITPQQYMWMSGYASRTKPAEGKHTDIYAKALVLDDGKTRLALITLDLVGIGRDLSQAICQELEKKYRLPRSAVIINVSHTHSGPVVGNNLLAMYNLTPEHQQLVKDYATTLQRQVVTLVGQAQENLAPARISWGVGRCSVAVNRRNNKEADILALRAAGELKGPIDHDVPVLVVRPQQGDGPSAIVFGYACHATVLSGYDWSGDYPGCAQRELEKMYPGAVALFWAGCGGDQNPLPRRKIELAEKYGRDVAESVQAVLKSQLKPVAGTFNTIYREIQLPLDKLPNREELAEQTRNQNKYIAARARMLLEQMKEGKAVRSSYPYPISAWQLGDGPTLVALGGEVVVDYALRLKKELAARPLWVLGYSNDVMAYIPSLRVLREGGYEGASSMIYYGLPGVWGPRVEELIVAAVGQAATQVRTPAK